MGVRMKIRIKGSAEETTAWKRRIYFWYDRLSYVVILYWDADTGYHILWTECEGIPISNEPKWVREYCDSELKGKSFAMHLHDLTWDGVL